MAEKKVSGKSGKSNRQKRAEVRDTRAEAYEDFLAKHGSELRKRSTRTVAEPERKPPLAGEPNAARCEEIDPHTTRNPALQRQISTKRSGRVISDDTGFKSASYNSRFELRAEMPESFIGENAAEKDAAENYYSMPGQQTMADFAKIIGKEDISAPLEPDISEAPAASFADAYKSVKSSDSVSFGKSEKLRAIARTAADDAQMEPESQLSFPAFDPLFKFPENGEEEKTGKKDKIKKEKKEKNKRKKDKTEQNEPAFDIEEAQIVTGREIREEERELPVEEPEEEAAAQEDDSNKSRIFDLLEESAEKKEAEPLFEINEKKDVRSVCEKIIKSRKTDMIKALVITVLGIAASAASLILGAGRDNASPKRLSAICFFIVVFAAVTAAKELAEGARDIFRAGFSVNSGNLLILTASLIQTAGLYFIGDGAQAQVHILVPAAVFSLLWSVIPKIFLADNSLTVIKTAAKNGDAHIFKRAGEAGIEGSVAAEFAGDKGELRYNSKTEFMSGLMKALSNPVPKPFGMGAACGFTLFFAIVIAVASSLMGGGAETGLTVFSAILTVCMPVTYLLSAAVLLKNADGRLAESKSSLLSYKNASRIGETKAVILSDREIIERDSCVIHGLKPFGRRDPKTVTVLAASVMINAGLPLDKFMAQTVGDEPIPSASDIEIFEGRGVKATVDHIPVILGTQEFLEECSVLIPASDFEERFLTGDRRLLCFAVGGEFSMLFTVSYHIKRSTAAFLKQLSEADIKILLMSADPNVSCEFVEKRCKLNVDSVRRLDDSSASYFREKTAKTDETDEADAFTDGKLTSLSKLFAAADKISGAVASLPMILYILSFASALIIAVPAITGVGSVPGNVFIVLLKLICSVLGVVLALAVPKNKSKR